MYLFFFEFCFSYHTLLPGPGPAVASLVGDRYLSRCTRCPRRPDQTRPDQTDWQTATPIRVSAATAAAGYAHIYDISSLLVYFRPLLYFFTLYCVFFVPFPFYLFLSRLLSCHSLPFSTFSFPFAFPFAFPFPSIPVFLPCFASLFCI